MVSPLEFELRTSLRVSPHPVHGSPQASRMPEPTGNLGRNRPRISREVYRLWGGFRVALGRRYCASAIHAGRIGGAGHRLRSSDRRRCHNRSGRPPIADCWHLSRSGPFVEESHSDYRLEQQGFRYRRQSTMNRITASPIRSTITAGRNMLAAIRGSLPPGLPGTSDRSSWSR